MNEAIAGLLGAVIVAALTLSGNLAAGYWRRRNNAAEARSTDADVPGKITAAAGDLATKAVALVNELQDEVGQLREKQRAYDLAAAKRAEELANLKSEVAVMREQLRNASATIARLEQGIAQLSEQVRKLGHEPTWHR